MRPRRESQGCTELQNGGASNTTMQAVAIKEGGMHGGITYTEHGLERHTRHEITPSGCSQVEALVAPTEAHPSGCCALTGRVREGDRATPVHVVGAHRYHDVRIPPLLRMWTVTSFPPSASPGTLMCGSGRAAIASSRTSRTSTSKDRSRSRSVRFSGLGMVRT